MKKISFILVLSLGIHHFVQAQENANFIVEISTDSILFGNYFQVKFTLENAQGDNFVAPEFEGFQLVSGPNLASSFSMINSKVSQSISYTYYLEPKAVGNYFIEPASIEVGDKVFETEPQAVIVVPNPDGRKQEIPDLQQRSRSFDQFGFPPFPSEKELPEAPQKTKKKKRKTYKI